MEYKEGKYVITQNDGDNRHIMCLEELDDSKYRMIYHASYSGKLLNHEELRNYLHDIFLNFIKR